MPPIASLLLQLVFGSLRLRSFAAGLAIGAVAHALAAQPGEGLVPPAVSALFALSGAASALCFALDRVPVGDAAARSRVAHRVLGFLGAGLLVAMNAPRWLG